MMGYNTTVKGVPLTFHDDRLTINNVQVPYSQMEDFSFNRENANFSFTYGGKKLAIPYNKEEEGCIESFFVNAGKIRTAPPTEEFADLAAIAGDEEEPKKKKKGKKKGKKSKKSKKAEKSEIGEGVKDAVKKNNTIQTIIIVVIMLIVIFFGSLLVEQTCMWFVRPELRTGTFIELIINVFTHPISLWRGILF